MDDTSTTPSADTQIINDLLAFIDACLDCKVDEVGDFFANHAEEVIAKAKGE